MSHEPAQQPTSAGKPSADPASPATPTCASPVRDVVPMSRGDAGCMAGLMSILFRLTIIACVLIILFGIASLL